jgi:hypothetical protein
VTPVLARKIDHDEIRNGQPSKNSDILEIQRGNKETYEEEGAVMNTKEKLISEIEETPEPLLSEVLDFVHFLESKDHSRKVGYRDDERVLIREGLAES